MTNLRNMILGLAMAAVVGLTACTGSSGGTGGGGGGGAGGGGGTDGGQCSAFTTNMDKLLNAATAPGVTVVKKTPNHPALDGGLP